LYIDMLDIRKKEAPLPFARKGRNAGSG